MRIFMGSSSKLGEALLRDSIYCMVAFLKFNEVARKHLRETDNELLFFIYLHIFFLLMGFIASPNLCPFACNCCFSTIIKL